MLVWIKDSQNHVHNCACDITKTSASVLLLQALLSHEMTLKRRKILN